MVTVARHLLVSGKLLLLAGGTTVLFLQGCRTEAPAASGSGQLQMASDYVFAACLIEKYADSPLAEEAEVWAQGLVEHGDLAAEAYPRLASLVKLAPEPGTSSSGKLMLMSSCIALYSDSSTNAEVRKIVHGP